MSDIKLKICGVNNIKIINHCIDLGIDFVGFIFNVKESHRNIDFDTAKNILSLIHNKIETVVVTKNPTKETILSIAKLPCSYVQIHGNFSPDEINKIKKLSNKKIITAFNLKDKINSEYIESYADVSDFYLLDSISSGSGASFDWSLLKNISLSRNFFLSGGLNKKNIRHAISSVKTNYFDLSSGVENKKHVKDENKITDLLEEIRG